MITSSESVALVICFGSYECEVDEADGAEDGHRHAEAEGAADRLLGALQRPSQSCWRAGLLYLHGGWW